MNKQQRHASVEILCTHYGDIGGFIFDGNWCRPGSDWKYDRLYSTIRSRQPQAVIIDNTGLERPGVQDHPEIDAVTFEQHAVTDGRIYGKDMAAMRWLTLNTHWGWSLNDYDFKSGRDVLEGLTDARRCGAVYCLNMAPRPGGELDTLDTAVLDIIGRWMRTYGDAVRKPVPSSCSCSDKDFLLEDTDSRRAYYFCHNLAIEGFENVTRNPMASTSRHIRGFSHPLVFIRWMDSSKDISWNQDGDTVTF